MLGILTPKRILLYSINFLKMGRLGSQIDQSLSKSPMMGWEAETATNTSQSWNISKNFPNKLNKISDDVSIFWAKVARS